MPQSLRRVIQCLPAYPDVTSINVPIDLALVAVPAREVLAVARDCAAADVRALVVFSAGFGETGAEGRARQAELLAICRVAGMRLVGPNCLGVINTDPNVRLNATFTPQSPRPGRIGVMSQSGALGLAIIDYANDHRLGISTFVSAGNKADLSGNDLLEYWEQDPGTDAIVALSRVVREPAELFQDRAPRRCTQADHRDEKRPVAGGCARRIIARGCVARGFRCAGRRPVSSGRDDPYRHA